MALDSKQKNCIALGKIIVKFGITLLKCAKYHFLAKKYNKKVSAKCRKKHRNLGKNKKKRKKCSNIMNSDWSLSDKNCVATITNEEYQEITA